MRKLLHRCFSLTAHSLFDGIRRALVIGLCFALSMTIWLRTVIAQESILPAKTMKDQQQDDHLRNTDQQVVELRELVHELQQDRKDSRVELVDAERRLSSDEGLAQGGFIVLGLLEGLGFIVKRRSSEASRIRVTPSNS
jgi:hypothetical protein